MLGNFSFGDYFKEDAIAFAWELLTKVYELAGEPPRHHRLQAARRACPPTTRRARIWRKVTGFGDDRILGLGIGRQLLADGRHRPLRPVLRDPLLPRRRRAATSRRFGEEPRLDGSGWTEIWNLVFMQFDRADDGRRRSTPLPAPCVDTGMGLERISQRAPGRDAQLRHRPPPRRSSTRPPRSPASPTAARSADDDVSMRVIADHARTTAFLIAEGVMPDRAEREYVLRRVMRRAIRHGHRLGIERAVPPRGRARGRRPDGRRVPRAPRPARAHRPRDRGRGGALPRDDRARARRSSRRASPSCARGRAHALPGATASSSTTPSASRSTSPRSSRASSGFEVDVAGYERDRRRAARPRSAGSKVGDAAVDAVYREARAQARRAGDASPATSARTARARSSRSSSTRRQARARSSIAPRPGDTVEVVVARDAVLRRVRRPGRRRGTITARRPPRSR